MANQKISDRSIKASVSGSEKIPVGEPGDPAITPSKILTYILSNDVDTITLRNAAIDLLKGSVPVAGDTLEKLYNLIIGIGQLVGNHDASTGLPTTGTGISNAIDKGDFWYITTPGTISGLGDLAIGDVLFAKVNNAAVAADFFYIPFATLINNGSETENGIFEEATDAETAAGTAVGSTGARLVVNPAKLMTWWTSIKAAAQTITAKWTFNDLNITNQIQSGKSVPVYVRASDGQLTKIPWIEFDTTNQIVKVNGVDDTSASVQEWYNFSGQLIAKIRNDRALEIGGTIFEIEVPSSITAGNASISFNDIEGEQLAIKDKLSNKYLTFEKLSSSNAANLLLATGTKILRGRRVEVFDKGIGQILVRDQITPVTTTTGAAAQNVIQTISVPTGKVLTLKSLELVAIATDGTTINYPLVLTILNLSGTVTVSSNLSDGLEQELPSNDASFNTNISGTNVELRFQNTSGAGKSFTVYHAFEYSIKDIPT